MVKLSLVQQTLSNRHVDMANFLYTELTSIAVTIAKPHSTGYMRKLSCVNVEDM